MLLPSESYRESDVCSQKSEPIHFRKCSVISGAPKSTLMIPAVGTALCVGFLKFSPPQNLGLGAGQQVSFLSRPRSGFVYFIGPTSLFLPHSFGKYEGTAWCEVLCWAVEVRWSPCIVIGDRERTVLSAFSIPLIWPEIHKNVHLNMKVHSLSTQPIAFPLGNFLIWNFHVFPGINHINNTSFMLSTFLCA